MSDSASPVGVTMVLLVWCFVLFKGTVSTVTTPLAWLGVAFVSLTLLDVAEDSWSPGP